MDTKTIGGSIIALIIIFLLMTAKAKNHYKKSSGNFLPFCVPIPLTGMEICLKRTT